MFLVSKEYVVSLGPTNEVKAKNLLEAMNLYNELKQTNKGVCLIEQGWNRNDMFARNILACSE